jgi:hypothetical protein
MSLLDTASLIVTPNGYKEGKLYSVIPSDGSGDMSVVRATTATRVNSAGLVELVPYNLLRNSQDFTSVWAYDNNTPSANTIAAPDGTLTADTIVNNNTNAFHRYYQGPLSNLGEPQTISFSVYLKYKDHQYTSFGVTDDSNYRSQVVVDLMNGTITENYKSSGLDTLTSTITNVGNGWYRVTGTLTYATALDGGNAYVLGMLLNQSTFATAGYVGSGTGIYIWGAQLVEGSTAKDYQKTETRLNIPRLDYSNGTCPSLLVEPQRTNLVFPSNDFSPWLLFNSATISTNTTISPDGTQNADTLNFASSLASQVYSNQGDGLNTHTASVWAKSLTGKKFRIKLANATTGGDDFSSDFTTTSEWQRFTFTTTSALVHMAICNESAGGAGTIQIWGAQLEVGSYATSNIPTTSAIVTRNADRINKTGISSLIGQTEGTIFLDFYYDLTNNTQASSARFQLSDGSTNKWILVSTPDAGTEAARFYVNNNGSDVSLFSATNLIAGRNKVAVGYKSGQYVLYLNGVLSNSSTSSVVVPATSRLDFSGNVPDDPTVVKSNFNAAAIWKTRLTNDQLATLTTL